MTGDVLRRIREARGIALEDVRAVSPYAAFVLGGLEQYGVSFRKGAAASRNGRRRRNWKRVIAVIRQAEKRGKNGKV